MRFHSVLLSLLILALAPVACQRRRAHEWPVIGAARDGDAVRLEQLLKEGADPNTRAGVNQWTALMHAIHKGQEGSVRVLIAHQADLNAAGPGGMTPLMMAAGYGYANIVRLLLKAGANPLLATPDGANALTAAVGGTADIDRFTVGKCQTETVRALLEAAPDLRIANNLRGHAAILTAKLAGCREVVNLIRRSR